MLRGRHAGLALAARVALERLASDDSRMVAAMATAALSTAGVAGGSAPPGVSSSAPEASSSAPEASAAVGTATRIEPPTGPQREKAVPGATGPIESEAHEDETSSALGTTDGHRIPAAVHAPSASHEVTSERSERGYVPQPPPSPSHIAGLTQTPPDPVRRRRIRIGLIVAAVGLTAALVSWGLWGQRPDGQAGAPATPLPSASGARLGSWEPGPDLLTAVEAAGVTAHRGAVWAVGGNVLTSPNMTKAVQVLHAGQPWSKGPPLPVPLRDAVAVSTRTRLYVIGGVSSDGPVSTVYWLDERAGRWVEDSRGLPAPRSAGAGVWDGSRLLFAGGLGADGVDQADIWALGAKRWELVAKLSEPRNSLGAASDGAGTSWFLAGQLGAGDAGGHVPATGTVDQLNGRALSPLPPVAKRRAVSATFIAGVGPCVVGGVPDLSLVADGKVECPLKPSGTVVPSLRTPRGGTGTAVLGGRLYSVGGFEKFGQNGSVTVEALPLP